MFGNYDLWFEGRYQFDFVNVKVNYLVRSMFTMYFFCCYNCRLYYFSCIVNDYILQ